MRGTVFNLQRFSMHDGPGIRTTVFLKGCSLHCRWCQNPESLKREPELQWDTRLCLPACDLCCQASSALQRAASSELLIARQQLSTEMIRRVCECCPSGALRCLGEEQTVDQILAEVLKDRAFYQRTGGGLTLSGGEPFMQPEFTLGLLQAAHAQGLHTAVETCLHVPWAYLEPALPYVDLWLADLKQVDAARFQEWTGGAVKRVLENLSRLSEHTDAQIIRIPLIPEFNADPVSIQAMVDFIACRTRVKEVHWLPYHTFGKHKYQLLGMPYLAPQDPWQDESLLALACQLSQAQGLNPILRGEA